MGERIRAFDWSATPLGPLEGWPPGVRNVVDLMLDARQPACAAWGPDLTLLYNDACTDLLGSRHPDALGAPCWQLGPQLRNECRPIVEATLAGEAQHFLDRPVPLAGPGGEPVRWFTFCLRPLRDPVQGIIGFYCAATQMNENVRSQEAALRESQGRFRTLVQSVRDYAILMIDAFGRVVEWTEGAERVKGYAAGEVLGRHVSMFHTPEDVAVGEPERMLARAALDGRIECEGWRVRKSGERFWVNEIATALRDPGGRLEGFAMVCRDMTVQRRAEEALRAADRRKDEFLATLAHELRNPLAPIRSALQVLRRGGAEADAPRLLGMIGRQVEHMVRLVDDLMDVSRISRGVIGLSLEPLDLRGVLRTAVEAIEPAMERRRHAFVLDLSEEALPVQGDAVRLAQVFANLLDNAAKYTGDGGHIRLQARCEGAWVVVAVRDDGIGIAAEQFPRLFEMFGRLDHGAAHTGGGLGIGLNLAQRLVQMHGGRVNVASDGPGQGSEFTVRLPLAARSVAVTEAPLRNDAAKPLGQRVLVVDDNCDGAESLGLLLELDGHDVRVVHDGASALAEAARQMPQVVLLDLGMPGMDGYEVARRLRADRRFDGVLLVALTGWGQDEDRRRTREAGFDRHLVKPIDSDTLQALLASLPSSRRPAGAPMRQPDAPGRKPASTA